MFINHTWACVAIPIHLPANVWWKSGEPKGSNLHESICKWLFWVLTDGRRNAFCGASKNHLRNHWENTVPVLPFPTALRRANTNHLWASGKFHSKKSLALIPVTEGNLDTYGLPVIRSCSQQLNRCWANTSTVCWVQVGLFASVQWA